MINFLTNAIIKSLIDVTKWKIFIGDSIEKTEADMEIRISSKQKASQLRKNVVNRKSLVMRKSLVNRYDN